MNCWPGCRTQAGLQQQLPADHPLLQLHKETLKITHPNQHEARENYVNTASRVLRFVNDRLESLGHPPVHWVDLLLAPKIIMEYFEK